MVRFDIIGCTTTQVFSRMIVCRFGCIVATVQSCDGDRFRYAAGTKADAMPGDGARNPTEGSVEMIRFRILALAAAALVVAASLTACTSTTTSRDPNLPLNSACAIGFSNDRPCSY
jgi:hypothetical protein